MKLATYLKRTKQTQAALASSVGIGRPHMSALVNGKKLPSFALALRIERHTRGAVRLKDFA